MDTKTLISRKPWVWEKTLFSKMLIFSPLVGKGAILRAFWAVFRGLSANLWSVASEQIFLHFSTFYRYDFKILLTNSFFSYHFERGLQTLKPWYESVRSWHTTHQFWHAYSFPLLSTSWFCDITSTSETQLWRVNGAKRVYALLHIFEVCIKFDLAFRSRSIFALQVPYSYLTCALFGP